MQQIDLGPWAGQEDFRVPDAILSGEFDDFLGTISVDTSMLNSNEPFPQYGWLTSCF